MTFLAPIYTGQGTLRFAHFLSPFCLTCFYYSDQGRENNSYMATLIEHDCEIEMASYFGNET